MTVLHYAGVGLFAEVARIDEEWPRAAGSRNAVVVLSLRSLPDVPSSVAIKALRRWAGRTGGPQRPADRLRRHPGRRAHPRTRRPGRVLGDDGIVPATDELFGALDDAVARAKAWIAAARRRQAHFFAP